MHVVFKAAPPPGHPPAERCSPPAAPLQRHGLASLLSEGPPLLHHRPHEKRYVRTLGGEGVLHFCRTGSCLVASAVQARVLCLVTSVVWGLGLKMCSRCLPSTQHCVPENRILGGTQLRAPLYSGARNWCSLHIGGGWGGDGHSLSTATT